MAQRLHDTRRGRVGCTGIFWTRERLDLFGAGNRCRSSTPLHGADTFPDLKFRLCGNEVTTDFSQARILLHV